MDASDQAYDSCTMLQNACKLSQKKHKRKTKSMRNDRIKCGNLNKNKALEQEKVYGKVRIKHKKNKHVECESFDNSPEVANRSVYDTEQNESNTYVDSLTVNDNEFNNISAKATKNSCKQTNIPYSNDEELHMYETSCDITDMDLDVTEEVLDFEPPLLHQKGMVSPMPKEEKEQLISQGVIIRSGHWSKKENSLLLRNWLDFIQQYGVDNPVLLLGLGQGNKRQLQKYICAKKMYQKLAKGLNDRTLYSVYLRARKLLNPSRGQGNLTKDEVNQLKNLHIRYGNKWTKIAKHMNRSSNTCLEAYRWHGKNSNKGHWTSDEDEQLIQAIHKVVGDENLATKFNGYSWEKIARLVPSRNPSQCRTHWLNFLCWKSDYRKIEKWTEKSTTSFIKLMYTEMVDDECFIDWDALYEKFKNCVVSYTALQEHWRYLKSLVPNREKKDHEEIVTYLYKCYLPNMLEKLKSKEVDTKSLESSSSASD